MSASDEDVRLLSVAQSISAGTPVDWNDVDKTTDDTQVAVLAELKALESLARSHDETPKAWGPFSIVGEIARGAFGTVYIANDPALGLNIALKIIRPRSPEIPLDPDKALNEARLLAKISHQNVVRVFRADRIGNEVGVAMELVKGKTLDDLVQTQSPFSPTEATIIGLDLCRALAAVHRSGSLHGDIKAHNVMRGEGGRTVLMDFGAGKDLNVAQRQPGGDFVGTAIYMAPEVFAGQSRSKASDIYSLGVLLYYLVSGTYPVDGSTRTEVERRHTDGSERRPLRDARPDLADGLIRVIERAIQPRAEERYQSAGELESALAGTLPAPVPSPPMPWWKVALVATALLLAVGLATFAGYRSVRNAASTQAGLAKTATPISVPPEPGSYSIDAALFREQNGVEVRLNEGARLATLDRLSLDVQFSQPMYIYVVNEDDHGESYLLFPLPGQMPTNPLPAGRHRLPGMLDDSKLVWVVTSTGGQEHFLIIASPAPSPTFEKLFATLQRPTLDKPAARLSGDNIGVLRSVGGLALETPAPATQLRVNREFAIPLTGHEETARGVWIRQATFANPD